MRRRSWLERMLAFRLRVRLAAVVLAMIVGMAIFAEMLAARAPLLAVGAGELKVLPALFEPTAYRGLDEAQITARHAAQFVVWPLVRSDPTSTDERAALAPMSRQHPLGTDKLGRDIFARLIYGARGALSAAFAALSVALLGGVLLGTAAGYLGGFYDELLSRPTELVETFPVIVVVAVGMTIFPGGAWWPLVIAVAALRWAEIARLVRAEVIRVSQADFVLAARACGCGHYRLLRRHILPHALRPAIDSVMFGVASVVLLEAAVAFLGIGAEGSWGAMIADGVGGSHDRAAASIAAATLALTVGALYLLADALSTRSDARVASTEGFYG